MTSAKRSCAAILMALACAACASTDRVAPSSPQPLAAYHLSPVLDGDGKIEALKVDITFASQPGGANAIRFPQAYASGPDLLPRYSAITAQGGVLKPGDAPGRWIIEAPPGQTITLSYRVSSGIDRDPESVDEQPFTPWIRDDWFIVFGQTLWARPPLAPDTRVSFEWDGPSEFAFASDLQHFPGAIGRLGGGAGLTGSTLLAGRNIRLLNDGPIRLAIHGQFTISDADLLSISSGIIQYQRAFFGASLDDPYLVNVVEVATDPGMRGSIGGTGQGDAFSISMARDSPRSQLLSVFAHETFHTWNLGRDEGDGLWIHEGFTDYYALATALRAGLASMDEFVEVWNDRLMSYALSPARSRRNADMTDRWADADSDQMQYLRGAIIAALWDRRFRETSAGWISLDDVVIEQYKRAALDESAQAVDLLREISAAKGVDLSADIERHIANGEPISLPANAFGPCLRVENEDRPVYDLGFDINATMRLGGAVQDVRPDSAAYAAGLRNDMRLIERIAGAPRDSTLPIAWIVETNGERRTIQWMPARAERMIVQRIARVPGSPADIAACGLD